MPRLNKSISHLDLFSGVGGFRHALELLAQDRGLRYKCVGFSEIDRFATSSYKTSFSTSSEIELGDIKSFASSPKLFNRLPKFNLLTGGFPCQSFSIMGNKQGFRDTRGDLANAIPKVLTKLGERKPNLLLLENVRNLKKHDDEKSLRKIIEKLKRSGYSVASDIFDTKDYGLPQKRRRIFIFAELGERNLTNQFQEEFVRAHFNKISRTSTSLLFADDVLPLLESNVDQKYFLSDRIKPTILSNGTGGFQSRSEINQLIARPLTASMMKMHRACQDNYYSDEFITSNNPREYAQRIFNKETLIDHRIRRLTPREAGRLQGFDDAFFERLSGAGLSDSQLYKQFGNAVSVNVVYAILSWILSRENL